MEFRHHGDPPPSRRANVSAISAWRFWTHWGLSVRNRFGLRPAAMPDGSPAPLTIAHEADRDGLMEGVTTFNLHYHLPQFETFGR